MKAQYQHASSLDLTDSSIYLLPPDISFNSHFVLRPPLAFFQNIFFHYRLLKFVTSYHIYLMYNAIAYKNLVALLKVVFWRQKVHMMRKKLIRSKNKGVWMPWYGHLCVSTEKSCAMKQPKVISQNIIHLTIYTIKVRSKIFFAISFVISCYTKAC